MYHWGLAGNDQPPSEEKDELELQLPRRDYQIRNDTGVPVTEIIPYHLPTQDAWNQLRGLKLRIELLEKT
jgi:hypothetical protein